MLKNYIDTVYIKSIAREIDRYWYNGQTDYNAELMQAEEDVKNDFVSSGRKLRSLRPELMLKETGTLAAGTTEGMKSAEDTYNVSRIAVETFALTGSGNKTIKLQGTNSAEGSPAPDEWNDVRIKLDDGTEAEYLTINAAGLKSGLIKGAYAHYRIVTTIPGGESITFKAFLVESIYDLLYAYKFLVNKLINMKSEQMLRVAEMYMEKYNSLLGSANFAEDADGDGSITGNELRKSAVVTISR